MQVISNERIIFFDVDDTLVMPIGENEPVDPDAFVFICDPYDKALVRRHIHRPHRKMLINYHARGAKVIVWSKNGVMWAEAVIKALDLSESVDMVMCKPIAFVDDQPPAKWMGEHVFIPSTDSFGQES